jgi:hypothetical protein
MASSPSSSPSLLLLPLVVVVRKRTQTNKARHKLLNASGVLATERARITKEISAAPTPNRRYKSVVIAQDLKRDFSGLENGKKKTSIVGVRGGGEVLQLEVIVD